jgi:multiple sugar transport system permease protein
LFDTKVELSIHKFIFAGKSRQIYQALEGGLVEFGFDNWRPVLLCLLHLSIAVETGQILSRGAAGYHAMFVRSTVLLVISVVIVATPLEVAIAFTEWNLTSFEGQKCNGFDNHIQRINDPFF